MKTANSNGAYKIITNNCMDVSQNVIKQHTVAQVEITKSTPLNQQMIQPI